jgi:hypothetical protein
MASERFFMRVDCSSDIRLQRIHWHEGNALIVNAMLVKEVSRALEELAAIIARLQFVAAELQKAKQLETRRQRKQAPPDNGK